MKAALNVRKAQQPSIFGDVNFVGMNRSDHLEHLLYKKLRDWVHDHPNFDDSLLVTFLATLQGSKNNKTTACTIRVFMGPRVYKEMARARTPLEAVDTCITRLNIQHPQLELVNLRSTGGPNV